MKDLKILAALIVIVGLIYWGVEPYAHSVMHPALPAPDYTYGGVKDINLKAANVNAGKELVAAQCSTCHSLAKADINRSLPNADTAEAYGVLPPDLSNAGAIYSPSFLVAFLQDPAKVTLAPKTAMPNLGLTQEQASDIVAYLKSVSDHNLTGKQITETSCGYCHTVKYNGVQRVSTDKRIKDYLGKVPPDLSLMIKSRGEHYLQSFINNPQGVIPGTGMPRLGLTQDSQEKVVAYLEEVGDPKKDQREGLGLWVLGYFAILTLLTFLWKSAKMREVH